MLFQELIEHHIVDCFVSDAFDSPLPVTDRKLGVYLGNVLGDQAVIEILWRRAFLRIDIRLLKAVSDRFELVEQLAGIAHWLNVLLIAPGRNVVPQFAVAQPDGNKLDRARGRSLCKLTDIWNISSVAEVLTEGVSADTNNVIGGGGIEAAEDAETRVRIACRDSVASSPADSRVFAAGGGGWLTLRLKV